MTISATMLFILLAILVIGVGWWFYGPGGPRTKTWVVFGCFVVAAGVILFYAGVLRVA